MPITITQDMIDFARQRFIAVLEQDFSDSSDDTNVIRRLDVGAFVEVISLHLLVPFFVGWTSSASLEALRRKLASLRSSADAKKEIEATVGTSIPSAIPAELRDLRSTIVPILVRYGMGREKAEQTAHHLVGEIRSILAGNENRGTPALLGEQQNQDCTEAGHQEPANKSDARAKVNPRPWDSA
jgi:hypothetical protein